ncbi:MAG: DUF1800 domain-containing protein [Saprospiraceae bacterium]|nr:DUF1800 domain-containing protein [Saprospiraceae bacterium]
MPDNKCFTGGLQEYVPSPSKPWNEKRIHHLYNKISNGAPLYLIQAAKANKPSVLVDYLISTAISHPLPGEKKVGVKTYDYTYAWKEQSIAEDPNAYYKYLELVHMWFNGMVTEGVRHKLVLFWSNHFVATADVTGNRPTWVFQYYYLLHKYALGDFREFVKAIGLTPAMILYLNGNANVNGRPNENYARELLELFTMGVGNYTQKDVAEVARALTGWNISYYESPAGSGQYYIGPLRENEFVFYRYNHDWKGKVIFGQQVGNNGGVVPSTDAEALTKAKNEYDKLHDEVIFKAKKNEVAKFICKKLYKYYLYNDPPQDIIDGLATVFINSNFNIASVLKTLFKSEHFYEDEAMGLIIKSHIDNQIHYCRSLDLEPGKDYFKYKWINNSFQAEVTDPVNFPNTLNRDTLSFLYYANNNLGQTLFNPINVAGWPGYRSWLNEFTLVNRWKYNRDQMSYYLQYDSTKTKYRNFLKDISNNSKDPDLIVRNVINYFMTVDLDEQYIQTAIGIFKASVPSNYYLDGTWSLDYVTVPNQLINLMNYLVTLPGYQLL